MANPVVLILVVLSLSWASSEIIRNREFKYVETPENWYIALEKCAALGMQLLSITDNRTFDDVKGLIVARKPRPSVWVAASDLGHEGTLIHITNGQRVPLDLFATSPKRQPDNYGGREHCVEATLRWGSVPVLNDIPCNSKFSYICEKILPPPPPVTAPPQTTLPPPAAQNCSATVEEPKPKSPATESCSVTPAPSGPTFCTSVYRC